MLRKQRNTLRFGTIKVEDVNFMEMSTLVGARKVTYISHFCLFASKYKVCVAGGGVTKHYGGEVAVIIKVRNSSVG